MTPDLWQRGCERLASELPEQQFNTWIRPLPPAEVLPQDDDTMRVALRVPNRFKLDWIRSQYAGRIETVLSDLAGLPVRLDLQLAPRELPTVRPGPVASTSPAHDAAPALAAASAATSVATLTAVADGTATPPRPPAATSSTRP